MHRLIPHPAHPPKAIEGVEVEFGMSDGDEVLLRYLVRGSGLALPDPASPERTDGLWQTTCFEMFVMPDDGGEAYFEFNFSPSTRWAAYAFDGYRAGMRDLAVAVAPHVDRAPPAEAEDGAPHYALEAEVDFSDVPPGALKVALTAVIEEADGTKSFWALNHPSPGPDFHNAAGFTLELPAATAA
jgi:hypothetical protein